ncbi:MAG: GNAT family N-acetyltransferase [Oscillospiraceae bacterium]
MLKLIENLSADTAVQLCEVFDDDYITSFVLFSLLDWVTVDGAWIQNIGEDITALIVKKENTKLYITANSKADFLEITEFIKCLGGVVVNCSSKITSKIGVTGFSKAALMAFNGEIKNADTKAVELTDDLKPVYDLITEKANEIMKTSLQKKQIKKFNDRAYKEWLSKTSRGILNGYTSVRAIKAAENSVLSVAIADKLYGRAYIRDVTTDSAYRKMGYGSDCIKSLCKDLLCESKTIFLCCDNLKAESFYKKIGFEVKDYIELGIVEL